MKKIRQNNDIDIVVKLKNEDGVTLDPTLCSNMAVYLTCGSMRFLVSNLEKSANGNIKFRFLAEEQTKLGTYNITITAKTEDDRTFTTDVCDAFNLVACSCLAGQDDGEVNIETIEVNATFEISAWGVVDNTEAIAELKRKVDKIVYHWDSFNVSVKEGKVSQEVYNNLLIADVVTNNGAVFSAKIVEGTTIILVYQSSGEGGEGLLGYGFGFVTVKEDLSYTVESFDYNLPSEELIDEKLRTKQSTLVSGENIKTINNQSILGEGNITIEGGGSFTPKITSTLNVTSVPSIQQAQATLKETYSVGFFLIADDKGSLPSSNKEAVVVSPPCQKQLSLSSPNPSVQNILNQLSADNFKEKGMNVGDIIALARVPVSIDDLAKVVGLSSTIVSLLKALGLTTIEVFQYKVWATTGTKWKNFTNPDGTTVPAGTEGLMSVYDKEILDANNLSTKYGYGTNFDDCLQTGICAYSPAHIGGVTENFTLVVQSSSNVDSGGFNSIIQTAYGRTGAVYNRIFQRMIFHNPSSGTRAEYHDWVEITSSNAGSTKYFTASCAPNVIFSTLESAKVNGFAEITSETEDATRGYTFKGFFYYVPTDGSPFYIGIGMITYNDTNLSEPAIMMAYPYNPTQIIGATRITDLEARIKALEDKLNG